MTEFRPYSQQRRSGTFRRFLDGRHEAKARCPKGRALADFLPTLTIKAKDFATELTSHNVIEKDIHGETSISKEHVENNAAARKILGERGVKPERLPTAEEASKVKRKLESESKKIIKDGKKLKNN